MRSSSRSARAILAAGAIAAAIAGCGGGDDDPTTTTTGGDGGGGGLTQYLPASSALLSEVDLVQAREQLGLPADADALAAETLTADDYDPQGAEERLLAAAAVGFPQLTVSIQTLEPDPVVGAFDGTQITEAATVTVTEGQVVAIRTAQSFDELAEGLEGEGFERDGDTLSNPDASVNEVTEADDGVVVIGTGGASSSEAVADAAGGPPDLVELLAPADQAVAQAVGGTEETCLTAFGGWENATGTEGVVRIEVEGEPDPDRVDTARLEKYLSATVEKPVVDGQSIEIPFTAEERTEAGSPIRDLLVNFAIRVYDCA